MDKIVVDSRVVIKWFVTEPLSTKARRILEDSQSGALILIAPDLLAAEIGNIVWKKFRLQGLAKQDAEQILAAFRDLRPSNRYPKPMLATRGDMGFRT